MRGKDCLEQIIALHADTTYTDSEIHTSFPVNFVDWIASYRAFDDQIRSRYSSNFRHFPYKWQPVNVYFGTVRYSGEDQTGARIEKKSANQKMSVMSTLQESGSGGDGAKLKMGNGHGPGYASTQANIR